MSQTTDAIFAARAKRAGARYVIRIVREARRADLPLSLAFALVEQESDFHNVFGHDRGMPFAGAGFVTKTKYLHYKAIRGSHGQGGMQGVGLTQLTYYSFQDAADRIGGCHRPTPQLRVGFQDLAHLIQIYRDYDNPTETALSVYNGGAGNPNYNYARQVRARQQRWHGILLSP